ncbi:MAG: Iron complex outer rane receptor protein [Bacteroidetes bacterium]|nr:Iron complex outer rane receptor protein [Bacteroidota bacterium]
MRELRIHITLLTCWSIVAFGQSRQGTIAGTVKDAETRQPVVGANVTLRGSFIGAATDAKGTFRLARIPVGSHAVIVSMLGYQRETVEGVTVVPDEVRTLDISVRPVPLQSEPVIITASRREQSLQEVPVSVATVTARMIAERNNITLDDALRYVPGVNMLADQVNIRGSSGYSRGIGSRVLVLLDGLPYITGDTGEINWETIPMFEVDRLEVVKGAGSALYGSSALGGVINVITRETPSTPELRFRAFSGLYDKPRYLEWDWSSKPRFNSGVVVSYSGRSNSLSYRVSVGRTVDESFRENDTYHRWNFFTKLKYDISSTQSLTIAGNYLDRTHGNYFWWKSLTEATRPAESQVNGLVTSRRGNVSLAYKEFLSDKFFYTLKGIYFGNFWRDDSAGRVNNVSASHLFNIDFQATYDINRYNVLTFGVAMNYDRVSANLFGTHPGAGAAAYAQDEIAVTSGLKVTAGLRFDWQKVSVLKSTAQVNPKLGLVYIPDKETSLRASFGSGFRYPAIGELYIESSTNVSSIVVLPNPDLKVETSFSYEVGVNRSFGQMMSIDLALFSNDFGNLIEPSVRIKSYRPYPSSPVEVTGPVIQFDNVTKARIQGLETVIRVEWWKRFFSTDVGYTYTWPRDLADNTVLKFRPRHIVYTAGTFSWDQFRVLADFRYLSRIERIDENLVRLAPIVHGEQRVAIKLVDIHTSYDLIGLGLPIRAGFNINNLLNYSYVELLGNLGPVRTYFLTLEGMF